MSSFSIIIPVFNGEKHIRKCIENLYNQVDKSFEVIIINDGSTDNTKAILEEIKKEYNDIKLIHKENTGVSDSRNIGIDIAKGEYVIFLDSDDELEKNSIRDLKKQINNLKYDVILFGFKTLGIKERYNDTDILRQIKNKQKLKEQILGRLIDIVDNIQGYIWRAIYSIEFLKENNIKFQTNLKISEDYMFLLQVINQANKIGIDDNEYYIYNINESSMSIKHIPTLLEDMMFVNDWMYINIVGKSKMFFEGYNRCVCNTYLRFVQTTVRDMNKGLISKTKKIYNIKEKYKFEEYFKNISYNYKIYSKKMYLSFILFRLNLEWLYIFLFNFKEILWRRRNFRNEKNRNNNIS